ncbi:MAG: ATP-dependent DNA helicase RecG [Acidimicrobiales bacterium]
MPERTLLYFTSLPVTEVQGVGTKTADALAVMEIETVYDLITHYPRRYLDRTKQAEIRDLQVGEEATIVAVVKRSQSRRTRQGRSLVEIDVFDGSSYLKCTFFNQAWRAKQLKVGQEVLLFGKLDVYRGRRQMTSPVVDLIGDKTGRIIPMYSQSEKAGVNTWELKDFITEALRRIPSLTDPLDDRWRDRLGVIDRGRALRQIHGPTTVADHQQARRRLVLDELLRLQIHLVLRKRAIERESKGIRHVVEGDLVRQLNAGLPFELTKAQRGAIREIATDLEGPHPMHRLLQGDVGSGKTLVAVTALLMAVQGGHQGALMAPTAVLAEQHWLSLRSMLDGLTVTDTADTLFGERPLRVELLTNRTTAAERKRLFADLASGQIDIVIGTHALITDDVDFNDLGVVVVDEQHRFGVEQRAALRGKGDDPDVLVMTATPIPRTAAMTVYGALDMTVLGELPPGRTPIKTQWMRGPLEESAAWTAVRSQVEAGHQAYVVCPLIEDSEKIEARSAEELYDQLAAGELKGLRLGILHGRVPAKDKEQSMDAFRRGEIDVLVATTVIEVGVDVPNATVMVVIDADRFGIAQLHQLRGRVGRSAAVSYCYLLGEANTPDAEERLSALERTTDGFELAEVDLELRGEGTILGTRQKGQTDLKLASLRRDKDLIELAREVAFEMVDGGAVRRGTELVAELEHMLDVHEDDIDFLFES